MKISVTYLVGEEKHYEEFEGITGKCGFHPQAPVYVVATEDAEIMFNVRDIIRIETSRSRVATLQPVG